MIQLCEKKRTPQPKYILVDTPGQIEIFTWSASGAIITEAFASTFPTMIAYVVDTARSAAPQTFMSNMLQVHTPRGYTNFCITRSCYRLSRKLFNRELGCHQCPGGVQHP